MSGEGGGEEMVAELGKDEGREEGGQEGVKRVKTQYRPKKFRRKRNFAFLLVEALVTELLINYKSCILDQAIEGLCHLCSTCALGHLCTD